MENSTNKDGKEKSMSPRAFATAASLGTAAADTALIGALSSFAWAWWTYALIAAGTAGLLFTALACCQAAGAADEAMGAK